MTDVPQVIDPRWEAQERVRGRFDVRVLEPSPPAVTEPPWFADDPVNDDRAGSGLPVLAPVPFQGAELTWDELARAEPDLASWCADRWLGAWRRLVLPADLDALVRTRLSWHTLAEHVLAPARYRSNGKIGLRFTRAGFGTPFFGADEQLRVAVDGLLVIRDGAITADPITTIAAAARMTRSEPGAPSEVYIPTTPFEPDAMLSIDVASARFLGDWFGFGATVLEELRAAVPPADTPARVQLWPEHFDLSVDFGDEQAGRRDIRRVARRRGPRDAVPVRLALEPPDRRLLERGRVREPEPQRARRPARSTPRCTRLLCRRPRAARPLTALTT